MLYWLFLKLTIFFQMSFLFFFWTELYILNSYWSFETHSFFQVKLQNSAEVESLRKNIESLEQANASSESQLVKTNQVS